MLTNSPSRPRRPPQCRQFAERPKLRAPAIRAAAQPTADTNGMATIMIAIGFGLNFSPSGPPTYAPIGTT